MSETAQQRLSRMLALVPWLMTHPHVTVTQTAAHFGISEAQLIKDLDLLIVSGRPGHFHGDLVDIQYWDDGGQISVLDPQTLDHPVAFSEEEAASILVSLQMLEQMPGTHDRAALISAKEKLHQAIGHASAVGVALNTESSDVLAEAISHRWVLNIEYADSKDALSRRSIEPLQMLVFSGNTYVEAWCRTAEALRTFRTDRIATVSKTGDTFAPRERSATPLMAAANTVRLTLRNGGSWVKDLFNAKEIESTENTIVVEVSVADSVWLDQLLLSLGPDVIAAPATCLQRAQAKAQEALSAMGRLR